MPSGRGRGRTLRFIGLGPGLERLVVDSFVLWTELGRSRGERGGEARLEALPLVEIGERFQNYAAGILKPFRFLPRDLLRSPSVTQQIMHADAGALETAILCLSAYNSQKEYSDGYAENVLSRLRS